MVAPILSLEAAGVKNSAEWLFTSVDLFIRPKERLALVGRNGAGKSTLMRLLAGMQELDAGDRRVTPGTHIVYLQQDPRVQDFATLMDFALSPDGDFPAPARHEVEAIAEELGLDLNRPAATSSGGERRRAALARAFAMSPDVMLLDEPTNHLDLAAIEWLENRLGQSRCAALIISHDRLFLTRLTKSVVWLDRGTTRRKDIGFGGFEEWSEQVYEEDTRAADKMDNKLRQELHWLQRGVTARRRRNQGRLRKLDDMRSTRKAMMGQQATAKLALATNEAQQSKLVMDAHKISVMFGDRMIIKPVDIRIMRGDRIGLVGPNGAGKTTLLRVLTGDLAPTTGSMRRAKNLDAVTIDQQRAMMQPGRRVIDVLTGGSDWIEVRGERKHIAGYLKEFLFDPKLAQAEVQTLSGGEQARILLAREFARPSNLLVLDEPTNDLDLETLDLLQEVIADYDGTVLIVSHDRDFLDRTVTMVLGLDGSGTVDAVAGGYADWDTKRKERAASSPSPRRGARSTASSGQGEGAPNAEHRAPPPQPSPSREREQDGAKRKLSFKEEHERKTLPDDIEKLEARITELELKLADPALYARDPMAFMDFSEALESFRLVLDKKQTRWLELEMMAEEV
jgi:ABC transport system ATP-binding/permease protein